MRADGRSRECLPIDIPAPRPCSAAALRTPSQLPGLSDRFLQPTLLFIAFFNYTDDYNNNILLLSTKIIVYRTSHTLSLWERWQPARADGEGFSLSVTADAVTAPPEGERVIR